jgi:hypothetical protein
LDIRANRLDTFKAARISRKASSFSLCSPRMAA